MPGINSEVREKMQSQLSGLNILSDSFLQFKALAELLIRRTDQYYTRNAETKAYPDFTERDRATMMEMYSQAGEMVQNLIAENPDVQELKDIADSLSSDMSGISQAKLGKGVSLPRIMDAFNEKEVDISNANLGRHGANLSSRIPMTITDETGNEVKGFFTPETKFDPEKLFDDLVDTQVAKWGSNGSLLKDFAKEFKDYARRHVHDNTGILDDFGAGDPDVDVIEVMSDMYYQTAEENPGSMPYQLLYKMMQKIGMYNLPPIDHLESKQFKQATPFEATLFNVAGSMSKIFTNHGIYKGNLGLEVGDNIDKRNAAMSTVAGLLGVPELIVQSKPMTVVNGDTRTHGTFLPNAEGKDINRLDANDKELNPKLDDYLFTNAYRDLADIQALDYICGNVDRHLGNMLFRFDSNGKFIGVQGIDNDASFGTNIPNPSDSCNQLPSPKDFGYMSQSMANRILELTPERLKATLASHHLDSAELEAACSRMDNLKQVIREGIQHYKGKSADVNSIDPGFIKVIPDEKFREIDILDPNVFKALNAPNGSTPSKMIFGFAFQVNVEKELKLPPDKRKHFGAIDQPTVRQYNSSDDIGMTGQANDYMGKLHDLQNVDRWYIRSSPQFRTMKTALQNLSNLTESFKGKNLTQEGYDRITAQFETLDNAAKAYVDMKDKQTGRSEYAESRLNFAKGFREFIAEKKRELVGRIKTEVQVREDRLTDAKLILENIKKELKEKQMEPKLAADAIRAANKASKLSPIKSKESVECMNLISAAFKYLKGTPDGIEASGIEKSDLMTATETVKKGMMAKGMPKEKVAEAPEVQQILQ